MKVFSGIQREKGVDYSSFKECAWASDFASVKKILTSLLGKCKRTTKVHPHFPTILKTNQQWAEMM